MTSFLQFSSTSELVKWASSYALFIQSLLILMVGLGNRVFLDYDLDVSSEENVIDWFLFFIFNEHIARRSEVDLYSIGYRTPLWVSKQQQMYVATFLNYNLLRIDGRLGITIIYWCSIYHVLLNGICILFWSPICHIAPFSFRSVSHLYSCLILVDSSCLFSTYALCNACWSFPSPSMFLWTHFLPSTFCSSAPSLIISFVVYQH